MVYRLWMNNKMQHYERFYKKWQDALSDIGGIAEIINLVAISISYFYNNYIIIADTEVLLSSFNNNYEKNNTNNIRKNNFAINIKKNNEFNNDNNISNNSDRRNNRINTSFNIIKTKEDDKLKSNSFDRIKSNDKPKNKNRIKYDYNKNIIYNKTEELINNEGKENVKNDNKISDQQKEKTNFVKYLIYKILCGKKYENIKVYENFREKIMSEKQLYQTYFYINELKMVKQEENSYSL